MAPSEVSAKHGDGFLSLQASTASALLLLLQSAISDYPAHFPVAGPFIGQLQKGAVFLDFIERGLPAAN
jgi:hypothetical protein